MDATLGRYRAIVFDYNGVVDGLHGVDAHLLQLADLLRAQGYRIGLLSNASTGMAARIREDGTNRHFDVFHASSETGFAKPQANAFVAIAADLGVTLEEMIVVDDSQYNLASAHDCGFTPLLYTGYDELIRQLTALGITTHPRD